MRPRQVRRPAARADRRGSDADEAVRRSGTATATMPGVPFGATQSTFTSSSGCSTGWPSHSVTRAGSPAISSASSEMLPVEPVDGVQVGGSVSHCDEERQLRVGLQTLDAQLLPEQLGAVGAVPVALDRLAPEALLERVRCRRPRRPSPSSRRRARSARARPARTAPCRRPGGRAPRRARGRCRRSAGGSGCGYRSAGARHRRRTPRRGAPRGAAAVPASPSGAGGEDDVVEAHASILARRRICVGHRGSASRSALDRGRQGAAPAASASAGASRTRPRGRRSRPAPSARSARWRWRGRRARPRRGPRCCPSSTSRGRGRRDPSRAGRTRRC